VTRGRGTKAQGAVMAQYPGDTGDVTDESHLADVAPDGAAEVERPLRDVAEAAGMQAPDPSIMEPPAPEPIVRCVGCGDNTKPGERFKLTLAVIQPNGKAYPVLVTREMCAVCVPMPEGETAKAKNLTRRFPGLLPEGV